MEANAKVAQSLFQMATQGKNVATGTFSMKVRGGWRERQEIEATQRYVISAVPQLSEQEWLERYAPEEIIQQG